MAADANEPIDSRKASRYATSEANKRTTAKISLDNHCKLDTGEGEILEWGVVQTRNGSRLKSKGGFRTERIDERFITR